MIEKIQVSTHKQELDEVYAELDRRQTVLDAAYNLAEASADVYDVFSQCHICHVVCQTALGPLKHKENCELNAYLVAYHAAFDPPEDKKAPLAITKAAVEVKDD